MHSLNLGILAHVDAGKTSLTERLLLDAGVIDELGSVDAGSTQTDSMALERRRGITIRSAVVSFRVDDTTVNIIDTPGHPDFIAEVERVLSVLDGAVLVVSAVEGVQAQTRVLMRTLRRLRIPTLVFVNKTDRRGADPDRVFREITTRLAPAVRADLTDAFETLAEHDDALLAAYVNGAKVSEERLRQTLATHTRDVHPVYFGSAITGAGVEELMAGLTSLLPTVSTHDGPPAGAVFKVERGPAGEKIAYVRMFDGTLRVRDRLPSGKVTAISVFGTGTSDEVGAGRIAKLWGLGGIRVGDTIGEPAADTRRHFAPPTLETVVTPACQSDRGALHAALTQLAEQDPLINLRQDDQVISVSLYGEVQKEVIEATLREEYDIEVAFRQTTTIHVERPAGVGSDVELIGTGPFLATVGLRVEPGPVGSGVRFELGVELGSMPYAFFTAVEESVHAALAQGLHGWSVTDVVVTMTHSGYWARQSHSHGTFDKTMSSTAGDFRNLTPLVLMSALAQAGTLVFEPMHRFRLEMPDDVYPAVLPVLVRHRAVPLGTTVGDTTAVVEGDIPAERVHALSQRLPPLTRGEGVLESGFDHYREVTGEVPTRPRSDHNPLNRKEYLLHVVRRV
ncbi:elongation factor G [Actinophytocola oryzae]|uniref:Ribosomal protection tetracycline resistance protein n=1 Tax=Actinophytocola oryzae TaxID=502181 RepID=A0A4R7VZ12_9PSEU|nr:TetM/TetW/TetO/TetS family tetracycline resistance ribosomal protection protein [Actinophytocola oryzae]TDV55426.1 ribosomal protection tetracycline resistance protein [Actinophytocola oryzae]